MVPSSPKAPRFFRELPPTHRLLLIVGLFVAVYALLSYLGTGVMGYFLDPELYSVVLDAGSTGTRVSVFRFSRASHRLMEAAPGVLVVHHKVKGGLSDYGHDPDLARPGLRELLLRAVQVIPSALRSRARVTLGATAGLRLLPPAQAEGLLEVARSEIVHQGFSLPHPLLQVFVMDGEDEAKYMWLTVNYAEAGGQLRGTGTSAVVDLGGGSVQLAYEVPAGSAPSYVVKGLHSSVGLYVHSWLGFGLKAFRMKVLEQGPYDGQPLGTSPCIAGTVFMAETYSYGGLTRDFRPDAIAEKADRCRTVVTKALGLNRPCPRAPCAFEGVWRGPGGAGLRKFKAFSYVMDIAQLAGLIPPSSPPTSQIELSPADFLKASKRTCNGPPLAGELLWLCTDLVYIGVLLERGFGVGMDQRVTVAGKIKYSEGNQEYFVEAAWPLGLAVASTGALV